MSDDNKWLKNRGPLLVDKVRGYFDRLPPWLREMTTIRVEHQKVDAKIDDLDPVALNSELKQELTDEKLRTNRYLGDGDAGSGNDMSVLPASNVSEIVLTGTGQVADVTETVSQTETHLAEGPPLQDGQSEQVGDLWVTKKIEAPTFDDTVFQLTRQDLIPPEFRALVPEKLEAHTVDGTAALPTLASGETVRREEQKKVGVKTVSVQSRDMSSTPVLTGEKVDPQWNGAILDLEQKIVPASTVVTQPFGTTDVSLRPIDGTNALQETWKTHTAGTFPVLFHRGFDADLQVSTKTIQKIVAAGAVIGSDIDVNTLDYEDRPIDAAHTLRKVIQPDTFPASYNTYTTQAITFPGILSSLSFVLVTLATVNRKEPQWVAGVRAPFTAPTQVHTVTEFFTSVPTPFALYTWAPTDITFKGISFSLNLGSVLTDSWSNIGVTYAGDAYYGNTVDRFSITATSPSASGYVSLIGTEVAISCVIDRYKRFWIRRTSFIVLR
jgi:hypothetical protein